MFRVESGELSLDLEGADFYGAAVGALKAWQAAEERICLCGVLTVKQLGPRGGVQKEKMFSTTTILEEMKIAFILEGGRVIVMPHTRPEMAQEEHVAGTGFLSLKKTAYHWPGEKLRTWEYVIRNPSRNGKPDAVVVVPFLKTPNRLVVIREFRVPINDYEIGFVAGLIDGDEAPEEAARRELMEEAGLTMGNVLCVSPPLFSSPGMTNENVIMLFCEATGQMKNASSEEEKIEVIALDLKGVEEVLATPPCSMSQKLWPILKMMSLQGFIGWRSK